MHPVDRPAPATALPDDRPVRLRRFAGAAAVLALLAASEAPAPAAAQPGSGRLVAVGDIHGAGDGLRAILQEAGLVDGDHGWSGGAATLVQTGDFTDRGPGVREIMDLLMRLEDEAPDAGGEVRVLLGNHEAMNIMGDVRDVTPAIFAAFASEDAERRREDAWRQYTRHANRRRPDRDGPERPDPMSRGDWMRAHPPGFVEYMEAMGPDGRYGRWLRDKSLATVAADTLFVHAGLSPELEAESVEALNDRARDEIERFDRHRRHLVDAGIILPFSTFEEMFAAVALELRTWIERLSPDSRQRRRRRTVTRAERALIDVLADLQTINSWSIVAPDGPLWFRGLALRPEPEIDGFIGGLLRRFGVARVVVGHSVTPSRRIVARAGGRVFLIDTGMLEGAYRGQPSALELVDGRITAIYPEERVRLDAAAPARQ